MLCLVLGTERDLICLEPRKCAWASFCINFLEVEERLNELELREEECEDRADKQ